MVEAQRRAGVKLYFALPLATPWDDPSPLLPDEPIDGSTYNRVCRAAMGSPYGYLPKLARAKARLSDALAGRSARANGKRTWTFYELGNWFAEGAVFDEQLGVILMRLDKPVETSKRHIRAWQDWDDDIKFIKVPWNKTDWHLKTDDWEIVRGC